MAPPCASTTGDKMLKHKLIKTVHVMSAIFEHALVCSHSSRTAQKSDIGFS